MRQHRPFQVLSSCSQGETESFTPQGTTRIYRPYRKSSHMLGLSYDRSPALRILVKSIDQRVVTWLLALCLRWASLSGLPASPALPLAIRAEADS